MNLIEVELGEDFGPVAAVVAAAILGLQAQETTGIEVHAAAHEVPPQRPALDAAARDVTRADHHVDSRSVPEFMLAIIAGRHLGGWLKSASIVST